MNLEREALISIIQTKHRTNHVLHLILSLVTLGVWVPVWLLVAVSNSIERGKIERVATDTTYPKRLGRMVGEVLAIFKRKEHQ